MKEVSGRLTINLYEHNGTESLMLELSGVYFPSTTNSRKIGRRWVNRNGKKFLSPFLMKNEGQQAALNEITALYIAECYRNKLNPKPHFDGQVTVLCLLGHRPGRWDSHNYSKSVGDWMQSVYLVEDDSKAEIFCVKRSDYSNDGGDILLIQPRNQTQILTEVFISQLFKRANGNNSEL